MCDHFDNNICKPKGIRGQRIEVPWFLLTDAVTKNVNFFPSFKSFSPSIFYQADLIRVHNKH